MDKNIGHRSQVTGHRCYPYILSFLFIFLPLSITYAQDKIVAIVNKDIITQKDLNDFIAFMRMQLSKEYKGDQLQKKLDSLESDLLDRLIEDRLILQEAKKSDIKIEESRVKGRLTEIKKQYNMDSEFQSELMQQGLVQADIEQKIREQLLMYALVDSKIREKITVRPEEITTFYNTHIKDFISPEERQLEMILLENEDQAKGFAYALRSGEKITELCARYPVTLNNIVAKAGGELKKEIEDVVFKLGVGEVSDPVKVDNKYYVFKLESITASRQSPLSEVQDRIRNFIFERKMQEQMASWIDELKNKSYIKVM